MSRIRGKNTKPEIAVRSLLHSLGYRFRLHKKDLPGKPDIVLSKYKTVIFVHGCFWHQHKGCPDAGIPKSNTRFWRTKLADNTDRDRRHRGTLRRQDWKSVVVWECELRRPARLAARLKKKLVVQR